MFYCFIFVFNLFFFMRQSVCCDYQAKTIFDSDLKMQINYDLYKVDVIESIVIIANNKKLEMTHDKNEVLKEIAEKLKLKIFLLDFYKHFETYNTKLWRDNSVDVNKKIYFNLKQFFLFKIIEAIHVFERKKYALKALKKRETAKDSFSEVINL